MEKNSSGSQKWRKVAYGGMQPGYDDNHTDESFLESMVTNASVVKRDLLKVMLDSVSISQYLCISALVVVVWIQTLDSAVGETSLLSLDAALLASGFSTILVTETRLSLEQTLTRLLKISFFISGLYILAPVYHTLTRSISSDTIWALSFSLLLIHLFLHDYFGSAISLSNIISLNASIIASVLIASRLPSRLEVFAVMLFSLQVFLFAPLVVFSIKKRSFKMHLLFSLALMAMTLGIVYAMRPIVSVLVLLLLVFVSGVCPYWLVRIQEYKFEINGPWDEAKLCFDITE